jgi:hypothetical protein
MSAEPREPHRIPGDELVRQLLPRGWKLRVRRNAAEGVWEARAGRLMESAVGTGETREHALDNLGDALAKRALPKTVERLGWRVIEEGDLDELYVLPTFSELVVALEISREFAPRAYELATSETPASIPTALAVLIPPEAAGDPEQLRAAVERGLDQRTRA